MASAADIAPIVDLRIDIEKRSSTTGASAAAAGSDEVRVVAPSQYKLAAACLADAFPKDEIVRYPIDTHDREHWSEAERFQLHQEAFEYITYAHCLQGLVTTTDENYGCVALWMPNGKNMDGWLTILRSGMWRLSYKLSTEGRKRFFDEFLPLLHMTKKEILGEREQETWYLVYIGTRSDCRRRGYAKTLIQHVTRKVRSNVGVYGTKKANLL